MSLICITSLVSCEKQQKKELEIPSTITFELEKMLKLDQLCRGLQSSYLVDCLMEHQDYIDSINSKRMIEIIEKDDYRSPLRTGKPVPVAVILRHTHIAHKNAIKALIISEEKNELLMI